MKNNFRHIIWDWNGTLFDDVGLCVDNINWLLRKYDLPEITKERYREIFTFPVIDYYKRAGFDLQKLDFKKIGKEWIDRYEQKKFEAKLVAGAEEIIKYFYERGIEQSILSAYSDYTLKEIVREFGLEKYFKHIVGLDNIYAESKIDLGKKLIDKLEINSDSILLIGDTVHDYDVSVELGCSCILVSSGHQSRTELEKCNTRIVDNLNELKELFE